MVKLAYVSHVARLARSLHGQFRALDPLLAPGYAWPLVRFWAYRWRLLADRLGGTIPGPCPVMRRLLAVISRVADSYPDMHPRLSAFNPAIHHDWARLRNAAMREVIQSKRDLLRGSYNNRGRGPRVPLGLIYDDVGRRSGRGDDLEGRRLTAPAIHFSLQAS